MEKRPPLPEAALRFDSVLRSRGWWRWRGRWFQGRGRRELFRHGLLPADDARQGAQRVVHGFRIGKNPGHVRLQNHHVRAALIAPKMFAANAVREIVFRLHVFFGRFS